MLTITLSLLLTVPIPVEVGHSVAGIRIGMTRAEVARRFTLKPDKIVREGRQSFTAGALYFSFDMQDVLVLVGVELQKSPGLRIGKVRIPARITAADFAKKLNCALSEGSGGRVVHCEAADGTGLDAYDSFGETFISAVHVGPG